MSDPVCFRCDAKAPIHYEGDPCTGCGRSHHVLCVPCHDELQKIWHGQPNELDLLFVRCRAMAGAQRCWLAVEHEGPCLRLNGRLLIEATPEHPACTWSDLGGCDAMRFPAAFKGSDVPRHLCRTHHDEWTKSVPLPAQKLPIHGIDPAAKACARCQVAIEPRASHYAGVPGHGILCPACHKEIFP